MKVSTKRAWALAWGCISMFGAAVGFLQFASMLLGFYNPITDDHMPAEDLPLFRFQVAFQTVALSLSAILSLRYVRRTNDSEHVSESID